MRTSSGSGSKATRRKSARKSGHGQALFNVNTLKKVVKLGVTGMVAMYVATILVNVKTVSSVAGQIATIIGLPKADVLYAAKGTGVAGIALRLHKELE